MTLWLRFVIKLIKEGDVAALASTHDEDSTSPIVTAESNEIEVDSAKVSGVGTGPRTSTSRLASFKNFFRSGPVEGTNSVNEAGDSGSKPKTDGAPSEHTAHGTKH